MEISILIVTKNRPDELEITLNRLIGLLDLTRHEVLVFIDGCKKTEMLITKYPWVQWENSTISISASPARNKLYKKAKGKIFIGLDDDAHPLSEDFITQTQFFFLENEKIGIIAFQEIKGIYESDNAILNHIELDTQSYNTNDFIGCGFAVRKDIYEKTNGFPVWMDIYGEESCLALEVINLGYDIRYESSIVVNHRVDRVKRLELKRNYFRFQKQLANSINHYLVYYPNPLFKIAKLLLHNFKKYALQDWEYFKLYFKAISKVVVNLPTTLKYRSPVKKIIIKKMAALRGIKY